MSNLYNTQMCIDENHGLQVFHVAIKAFEVEAINFGIRFIKDTKVRADYISQAKALSNEYVRKLQTRRLSPYQAAKEVNSLRNEIMALQRIRSTDLGRAISENLKKTGRTLEELCEHYAKEVYQKNFTSLTKQEQNIIYTKIVQSGGRSRPTINSKIKGLSRLGKGLLVLSLGIAVYNVATADDKLRAAGNEGVMIGGGFAGGAGGGALAGLACGPGAPVCVTIGVFVGGLIGAFGADLAFDHFF